MTESSLSRVLSHDIGCPKFPLDLSQAINCFRLTGYDQDSREHRQKLRPLRSHGTDCLSINAKVTASNVTSDAAMPTIENIFEHRPHHAKR
jgi:hypothetical protein